MANLLTEAAEDFLEGCKLNGIQIWLHEDAICITAPPKHQDWCLMLAYTMQPELKQLLKRKGKRKPKLRLVKNG